MHRDIVHKSVFVLENIVHKNVFGFVYLLENM